MASPRGATAPKNEQYLQYQAVLLIFITADYQLIQLK